jgi:hypothetical protein
MLRGKTVAIVGGSDNWDRAGAERCDIVVRVNANWVRQGGRMGAVYTREVAPQPEYQACQFVAFDMEADDEAWLSFCDVNHVPFVQFFTNRFAKPNPYRPDLEWFNSFNWMLRTTPLTGITAIAHLVLLADHPLFVTGFDFYAKDGVIPIRISAHEMSPQLKQLKLWASCGAIIPDGALRALLAKRRFGEAAE